MSFNPDKKKKIESLDLTCKNCQAFRAEQDPDSSEGVPGVCILMPPQMIASTERYADGSPEQQMIVSAFPKVDGELTTCMQLRRIR